MPYTRSLDLFILHDWNFVPFDQRLPIFLNPVDPANHYYTLWFYEFRF